ncbi:MAG: TlpA family protein disulfide reductase [Bacteriovoracaceae bacterium]
MKKLIPFLLFIMAFTGFLSIQIMWNSFHSNAELVDADKQKHATYETNFQVLKLTMTDKSTIELKKVSEPIVVLNFWASWCYPCLKEFPSLIKFQEAYRGKVKVIGINGDEEEPLINIQKTQKKYGLNFPSAMDEKSEISNKFLINTYPVSLIFHKGKIIYESKKLHDFMDKDFRDLIDNALKAN